MNLLPLCWLLVAVAHAYGPLPPVASSPKDTSPWIPIRRPKYYYQKYNYAPPPPPPPPPAYGMPVPPAYGIAVPPAPMPTPYQAPPSLPVAAQTMAPAADSAWMPIVPQQATEAPVQQEMAVMFEMPTESPALASPWMGQTDEQPAAQPVVQPALPATGRLPIVPLIFRSTSTASPSTSDQAPPSVWSAPESPDSLQSGDPASAQTPAPNANPDGLSPIGPPGTFLPLSSDVILPGPADPSAPQGPNSSDSWPDTPKDVPAADFLPTLPPATFGKFDVPPAGK